MNREQMLMRLSAAQFAMWEMHVYLDTHADDQDAQALYLKYQKRFEKLEEEFESKFGPIRLGENNSDEWLKDPWPWDNQ
ncbi:MAG: spore coat protein CotJB [Clostridiales bacterium]|nr:spore coat protein CotJB [Clostridiales bacterium]